MNFDCVQSFLLLIFLFFPSIFFRLFFRQKVLYTALLIDILKPAESENDCIYGLGDRF